MKNADRFAEILSLEVDALAQRKGWNKRQTYEFLGLQIGKNSGASVRQWASSRKTPSKIRDLESLANLLRAEGGLQGDLFAEFIVTGGHPNPAAFLGPKPPMDRLSRDPYFAGRESQLTELLERIQSDYVIGLIGTGGVGKTTLIAELIHRLTSDDDQPPRFPDGIFYYEFYKRPSVDVALEAIARRFGKDEPPANPQAAAQRYLQGKQALLILDGAEEADNLDALLQIRQQCGVLIASRRELGAFMNHKLRLDTLALPAAVEVLTAWSTRQRDESDEIYDVWTGQPQSDQRLAEQICELLGCLPLALRLAGDNLGGYFGDPQSFLETLQAQPFALLEAEQRQHQSVPFLLRAMISQLGEAERQALGVVGILSYEDFSLKVMATALGLPEHQVRLSLNQLTKSSLLRLVQRFESRYQVVHRLIHTYVADPAHGLTVPDGVIARLARHYIIYTNTQTELGTTGYAALDKERPHLLAMLDACQTRANWEDATSLVSAMDQYLHLRGHWSERLAALETGLVVAEHLDDPSHTAAILGNLGTVLSDLGRTDEALAYYEQALTIARKLGDRQDEAKDLSNMGTVYSETGQFKQAMEYFQQALEIWRELGDRANEGSDLGNLGLVLMDLGQIEEAMDHFEQALAIAEETGDRHGEGIARSYLGIGLTTLGWLEQAMMHQQEALTIAREVGDRSGECRQLGNIGQLHYHLEQYDEALTSLEQGLEIAHDIGEQRMEGELLDILGVVAYEQDRIEVAMKYYQRAMAIAVETDDIHGQATELAHLGAAHAALGELEQAKELCKQAIAIFEEIGSPDAEDVRKNLAEIEKAEKE